VHWEPTFPVDVAVAVTVHIPCIVVPDGAAVLLEELEELQLTAKTVKLNIKIFFILLLGFKHYTLIFFLYSWSTEQ
jgi:hypothetical protein